MSKYKLVTVDQRFTAETIARTGSEQLLDKSMRSFVGLYDEEENWYIPLRANLGNKKSVKACFPTPFNTQNSHFKNPGLDFEKAVYVPDEYIIEIKNTLPQEQAELIFTRQDEIQERFEEYVLSIENFSKNSNDYLFSTVPLFPEGIEKIKHRYEEKMAEQVQSDPTEDKWIIEFSEKFTEYHDQEVTFELLQEIKKLDVEMSYSRGYYKFYFQHIVNGKVVDDERIDIGDGLEANQAFYNQLESFLLTPSKTVEKDSQLQSPETEEKRNVHAQAVESTFEKDETPVVKEVDFQTAIQNKNLKALKGHLQKELMTYLQSEQYQRYLDFASSMYQYSPKNRLLALKQCPQATMLASYKDWKEKGRTVRQGEKALKVYLPYFAYKVDENGEKVVDENGKYILTNKISGWGLAPVFDVSQTEGKELPKALHELTENFKDPKNFLAIFNAVKSCTTAKVQVLDMKNFSPDTKGYYDRSTHQIGIRKGMSQYQTLKTEIHEVAHAVLHQNSEDISKAQKEFEAESVAYIVCKHYGVDTSDYSFPYLATWTEGGKNLEEFETSLKVINDTAKQLIVQIDKELHQQLTISENKVEERSNVFSDRLKIAQQQLDQHGKTNQSTPNKKQTGEETEAVKK